MLLSTSTRKLEFSYLHFLAACPDECEVRKLITFTYLTGERTKKKIGEMSGGRMEVVS